MMDYLVIATGAVITILSIYIGTNFQNLVWATFLFWIVTICALIVILYSFRRQGKLPIQSSSVD
jgi:hypothetical protein